MKFLIVSLALVAAVSADVSHIVRGSEADAPIVRSESDVRPDGHSYAYETGNGIAVEEQSALKSVGNDLTSATQGHVRYTSPEGQVIEWTYLADENGYQAQGAHLPVSPPVPEAILRSLEYIRTHAPKEVAQVYSAQPAAYQPPQFPNRFL